MKKILKFVVIIIMLIIVSVGVILFIFRGKISLFINITEKYNEFVKNESIGEEMLDLDSIESMDYKDVEYKSTRGVSQTLDIYGPKKILKKGSPVILYVHGGSWVYGNNEIPKAITPMLDAFREEGYTIISTTYQLMRGEEIFSKQISDVKDTIRWIHKNKDIYNFDEDNIGVIGVSSGAHLALMACYSEGDEFVGDEELKKYPTKVKYLIDFSGPTDLKTLDTENVGWDLQQVINSVTENKSEVLEKYSPINYIGEDEPTTLLVHSKRDNIVPYENAMVLYEKLSINNNEVDLLTLEGMSHDFSQINKDELIPIGLKMLRFIIKNM